MKTGGVKLTTTPEKTTLKKPSLIRIKNSLMDFLNINSLTNKFNDKLDYFVINGTKIDESFPSQQFVINNFQIRARENKDCDRGGLI